MGTRGLFLREARMVVRLAGADWRDIMLANLMYDVVVARFGCSTIAVATPDGPLFVRNMDWWPEDLLAQASCHLHYEAADGPRFTSAAWPGGLGVVTGLSRNGFGVALNAVIAAERFHWRGYPVLYFLRRVIEKAADFEQAVTWCMNQRLMSPCSSLSSAAITPSASSSNELRLRHAVRRPNGDEPLITTNDYRLLEPPQADDRFEIYRTTCARYEALDSFLGARSFPRDVADDEILFALSEPNVMQSITAQHVIIRPRRNSLRLFVPRALLGTESARIDQMSFDARL